MKAAETKASKAIAVWTPLAVVCRSRTTAEIDTFMNDVSTTRTNMAAARRIASRGLAPLPVGTAFSGSELIPALRGGRPPTWPVGSGGRHPSAGLRSGSGQLAKCGNALRFSKDQVPAVEPSSITEAAQKGRPSRVIRRCARAYGRVEPPVVIDFLEVDRSHRAMGISHQEQKIEHPHHTAIDEIEKDANPSPGIAATVVVVVIT